MARTKVIPTVTKEQFMKDLKKVVRKVKKAK
jgi:hypothetical protein